MSIIKGLFIALKNLRVIPFNEMTPEIHDTLGSNLAKVMMVAKMSDAKLTKAQREYVVNQAKQLQEFEDRYITGIKDKSGNVIKSDEGIKDTKSARIFNRMGEELDPKKPIVGGTQQGKKIDRETLSRLAERGPQLIKQKIADRKINEIKDVKQRIDSGVATTIEKMLTMDPVDAMKEANRVIKREGPYKNLSEQDAKKILQDTEDHIFERNIKPKETDMNFDESAADEVTKAYNDAVKKGKFKGTEEDFRNKIDDMTDEDFAVGGRVGLKSGSFLVEGAKELGKKYRGSTLEALLENPKLLGTELSYEGLMEILRMSGMMQKGGRVGFKKGMDRRTFMKIMGGLTTLPIVGKFFKGAEVAAPVVEKAAEVASGAPAYFFNLVNRIRALGKKFDGPKERSETYKYKDYEMQIDNDTGQVEITKQKLGYDDRVGEGVVSEEYMSFKPGRADETTGGKKVADEYEENTGFTDKDGKLKDVEPGVSEETVMDGSISKEELEQEIIEQLSKETPSIKKASGGIARMLGE